MRQVRIGGRRRGRTVLVRSVGTPYWHGHCNGWAAAAIRHREPQRSVTKNAVVEAAGYNAVPASTGATTEEAMSVSPARGAEPAATTNGP